MNAFVLTWIQQEAHKTKAQAHTEGASEDKGGNLSLFYKFGRAAVIDSVSDLPTNSCYTSLPPLPLTLPLIKEK